MEYSPLEYSWPADSTPLLANRALRISHCYRRVRNGQPIVQLIIELHCYLLLALERSANDAPNQVQSYPAGVIRNRRAHSLSQVTYTFLIDNARREVLQEAQLMMASAMSVRDYTSTDLKALLEQKPATQNKVCAMLFSIALRKSRPASITATSMKTMPSPKCCTRSSNRRPASPCESLLR